MAQMFRVNHLNWFHIGIHFSIIDAAANMYKIIAKVFLLDLCFKPTVSHYLVDFYGSIIVLTFNAFVDTAHFKSC